MTAIRRTAIAATALIAGVSLLAALATAQGQQRGGGFGDRPAASDRMTGPADGTGMMGGRNMMGGNGTAGQPPAPCQGEQAAGSCGTQGAGPGQTPGANTPVMPQGQMMAPGLQGRQPQQ